MGMLHRIRRNIKNFLELHPRLVNIENKINILLGGIPAGTPADSQVYGGHPDQEFGPSSYAQHGDDFIVLNIFKIIGIDTPSYLDIGAHHPFNISNTALLHKRGARGINVEANPDLIEAFKQHRPDDTNVNIGVAGQRGRLKFYRIDNWSGRNTFSEETAQNFVRQHPNFTIQSTLDIDVVTLNDIVERYANGKFPDFLTMDVEGLDEEILASADFSKSKPTVVCMEAVSARSDAGNPNISGVMKRHGFVPYVRTTGNYFFVTPDAYQKLQF